MGGLAGDYSLKKCCLRIDFVPHLVVSVQNVFEDHLYPNIQGSDGHKINIWRFKSE